MADRFTWVPIYEELARKLSSWESRQSELIAFLEQLRSDGLKVTPLSDQDDQGAHFLVTEIDPFTFFGVFNRGIKNEQRLNILSALKRFLKLDSALPIDFDGIPVLNNQKSWFFAYQSERNVRDISRLWRVFQLALAPNPLRDSGFLQAFDEALDVRGTNFNLTIGLFWIRPHIFLNLDHNNRRLLNIKLPNAGLSAKFYADVVESVLAKGKPLPEISFQAWTEASQASEKSERKVEPPELELSSGNNFWMVGAYWSTNDPPDLTQRFLDEGVWKNGYKDRYLDEVRSMQVGDRIAIKAASTQRLNLPFDSHGKTVSRMTIKAIGTIVKNREDGRTVEVEWDPSYVTKDWFFYTNQTTLWRLRRDDPYAQKLIEFVFGNAKQDYDWFCKQTAPSAWTATL